jgi:exodeoxyribonuclease-1
MQFAGIRTDLDFNVIGEPVNVLVKIPEDVLPSPDAIMVTGITPQKTLQDGISEAEFAKFLMNEIWTAGTIVVGFNNIRFDDEFIRNVLWRNFRDPYEWQWSEGRSKWDLLDVTRLVRALRPEGINWPTKKIKKDDGEWVEVPTNNLVDLARLNGFENTDAHDALADVKTTIKLAELIRAKQPKMFEYLFTHRDKKSIQQLVNLDEPRLLVYASGRYSTAHEKTTVAFPLAPGKNPSTVVVYNLLADPADYEKYSEDELRKIFFTRRKEREKDWPEPPLKELNYGRCPAVAPFGTMTAEAAERLKIDREKVKANLKYLNENRGLVDKMTAAWNARPEFKTVHDVEGKLYDSFAPDADKPRIKAVSKMTANELADFNPAFVDERLDELLFRYKARNFPTSLADAEKKKWNLYRTTKFSSQIKKYMGALVRLEKTGADHFLLEELQLYAESIYPDEMSDEESTDAAEI